MVAGEQLLTMIVTGRNDSYMGNFKYRLGTCLDYLARNLARLGRLRDVEVLVTDWGSEHPLSEALPLTPEAASICRFQYVPAADAKGARSDGDFYPSAAINTSVRRARGRFTMLFDADSLFPEHSLRTLLDLLDGRGPRLLDVDRTFFFCNRHQVPWEVVQREPSLEEWDRYLLLHAGSLPADASFPGLGGSGAGQMARTAIWHELRGYNESLTGQGWIDVEFTLRVTQRYPWVDLFGLGVSLFHMEHWPSNRRHKWVNRVLNPYVVSPQAVVNGEAWGMAAAPVQGQEARGAAVLVAAPPLAWRGTAREVRDGIAGTDTRRRVASVLRRWRIAPDEWEALCAVAWYADHRFPRNFLEFGIQRGQAALAVAAACPGVEIYGLDRWEGGGLLSTPGHLAGALREVGHRAYARYVTGDPRVGWEGLRGSYVGPLQLDLALLPPHASFLAGEVAEHLSPAGMLVLRAATPRLLQDGLAAACKKVPDATRMVAGSGRCGFLIAAPLEGAAPEDRVHCGPPAWPALGPQLRQAARLGRRALQEPALLVEVARHLVGRVIRRRSEHG